MESDANFKYIVSELNWILRHPAGVGELVYVGKKPHTNLVSEILWVDENSVFFLNIK